MNDDKKYWIKPGIEVAHRDCITRKMYVVNIVRKKRRIKKEDGTRDTLSVIQGVACRWFDDNKENKEVYHTRELIPWNIASEGEEAINNWINS